MTNSCPRLTRIFCEAPERRPDSYRLSRRLATSPSNPCALLDAIRSGSGVGVTEIPSGLRQLGQHLGFQQRPAGFECLGAYIPSHEHQHIEHEEGQRRVRRAVVLQRVEGRLPVVAERHQLSVEDR